MISVQHAVIDLKSLSNNAQMILSWSDCNLNWLEMASNDQQHHQFNSELALIQAVYEGLHNTSSIKPQNCPLFADCEFFYQMSESDLAMIDNQVKQPSAQNKKNVLKIINEQQLIGDSDYQNLSELMGLLGFKQSFELGMVDIEAVIQSKSIKNSDLTTLAASQINSLIKLARAQCVNLAGFFIALSSFYDLFQLHGFNSNSKPSNKDTALLLNEYQNLKQISLDLGHCPNLADSNTIKNVTTLIQFWGNNHNAIGFIDIQSGIKALSHYLHSNSITTANYSELSQTFSKLLVNFQKQAEINSMSMSQDGQFWLYQASSANAHAQYVLSPDGRLMLDWFYVNSQ